MITSIFNVDSVTGSGVITFAVQTDAGGCDENCTASVGGTTHVRHDGAGTTGESVHHNASGPNAVVITSSVSHTSSEPVVLNL